MDDPSISPGSPSDRCPECGSPLGRTAGRGLCSRCLIQTTLSEASSFSDQSASLRSIEELNQVFPDFVISRLLGRGGMGAVYEARQKSLGRKVALKLLSPELMQSQDFLERLEREARVMARLEHPNIARVYESGISPGGEVFLVMELVEGEPITALAGSRRLGLKARLDLFVQVCAGVQHAHQKGIIHRDLKPSNILVTETDGQLIAKVIDFGLAKPTDHLEGDEAAWLSSAQLVGTPAYMSPEQATGGEVDARTDIYSLGVLLYELLTGRTPGEAARSQGSEEVRRPTPRPSDLIRKSATINHTASSPKQEPGQAPAAREVRQDLDAIVLKAIEPVPADRYQSVAALPEEIARYLRHDPVQAVPSTLAYRSSKFCRKHRLGLVAALAFVLTLLVGLGMVVRESLLTRKAERLAEEQLRRGERLIEFLLGDLHVKLQTLGRLDILESTVNQAEAFYARSPRLDQSPEAHYNRARALCQLGLIRNIQGRPDAAKAHYNEAIRLYEAAVAARPGNIAWLEELGQAWNSLAVFHHGRLETAPASQAYREALRQANALLKTGPKKASWIDFKASTLHNYGAFCEMIGRLDDAQGHYQEALELWEPLRAAAPTDVELIEHVSTLHMSLAFLHGRRKDPGEAKRCNAEALRLRETYVKLDPQNIRALSMLADIQQNISEVHAAQGEFAEAEEWLKKYRPIREQLAARDPANGEWQQRLIEAWQNEAMSHRRLGRLPAAAEAHQKALAVAAKLPPPGSSPQLAERLRGWYAAAAETELELAKSLSGVEKRAEFIQRMRATVELRAHAFASDVSNQEARLELGYACLDLSAAQLALGDSPGARAEAQLALLIFRKPFLSGAKIPVGSEQRQSLGAASGGQAAGALPSPEISPGQFRLLDPAGPTLALQDPAIRWPAQVVELMKAEMAALPAPN